MRTSLVLIFLWLGVLGPVPLQAQSRPIELGTDLSLSWNPDAGFFALTAPAGTGGLLAGLPAPVTGIRVGIPVSDLVSFEPATSLSLVSDLDNTTVVWNIAARLLYHFHDDEHRSRPYIAGILTLTLVDVARSATQFGVGAEAGVKKPISDQVGWRFGAGWYHGFDNDDFNARDILYGSLGISVLLGGGSDE